MARLPALLVPLLVVLLAPSSALAASSASIGAVDCAAGGVEVSMRTGGGPAKFVLERDGLVVATHVQAAGPARSAVVPLEEGVPALVTVRHGGSYASARVLRACGSGTPTTAPAAATAADAPFPAPVVAASATPTAAPAAADVAAAEPAGVVPEPSGAATAWLLLAAAALALAAIIGVGGRIRSRRGARPAIPADG